MNSSIALSTATEYLSSPKTTIFQVTHLAASDAVSLKTDKQS
jgi:hypothetical protein